MGFLALNGQKANYNGFSPHIRIDGFEIHVRHIPQGLKPEHVGYRVENKFMLVEKSFAEFHAANVGSDFATMKQILDSCIDLLSPENGNIYKEIYG